LFEAGRHSRIWDAGSMPSGVYIVTVKSPHGFRTAKMLLMK